MPFLANVNLSDTFDGQRIRVNEALKRLNNFANNESQLTANIVLANSTFTGPSISSTSSINTFTAVNNNISGGSLLITANTFHAGTLELKGITGTTANTVAASINETNDNILAFSIALG